MSASRLHPNAFPDSLQELRERAIQRDDATIHEGLAMMGIDPLLAHVAQLLPAAFRAESPAEPRGVVQFVLVTPQGDRHLSVARTESGLTASAAPAPRADATVTVGIANLLRMLANEPGRDLASLVAARDAQVTGDEPLVRALPSWLALPT